MQMSDFTGAVECLYILGDKIDDLVEPLRERERRAGERLNERRSDAVALRVPLVLLRDRAADTVESGIERAIAIEGANETAEHGRDRDCIVEPRAAVGDTQLDRRIVERGPYGPPDVARVGNDLRPGQRGNEFAIVLVGPEQLGQSGAGQLVIGSEPVTYETGQVPLPEWGGRRKGKQEREVGRQPHNQVYARVDVGHGDVQVHSAQHVPVTDHLQVVHDGAVTRLARHHLLRPEGEGKGPHGGETQVVIGGSLREDPAIVSEMAARLVHGGARRGGDLELRLQHLGHNPVAELLLRCRKEFLVRATHRMARLSVEQEVFLFHPECVHPRNNRPAGTLFRRYVRRKTAAPGGTRGGRSPYWCAY